MVPLFCVSEGAASLSNGKVDRRASQPTALNQSWGILVARSIEENRQIWVQVLELEQGSILHTFFEFSGPYPIVHPNWART